MLYLSIFFLQNFTSNAVPLINFNSNAWDQYEELRGGASILHNNCFIGHSITANDNPASMAVSGEGD